ncbi:glycoside hydrolase family 2 protein [Persicobacter diffluens]|uniref:Beta-glucuronidase n=1 Tax=Persicobacter diffluens TaxID=981 RepID=A0AAN4W3H9_9BACT|nr:beta-glucuronidase [Persicobacter diffluens]
MISKKILFYFFGIFFLSASVVYGQGISISNTMNRNYQSLNGKWNYILDPYETGGMGGRAIIENYIPKDKSDRVEYGFASGKTLWVPGSWNMQHPELTYYEGSLWYRRSFDMSQMKEDKRYFIYLGAANYKTTVSINGKEIGQHEGGFTPICFELTSHLKEKDNQLIVGVNNSRADDNIPSKVTDWFNHGGIIREVKVLEVPETFINNYFLKLEKSSLGLKRKQIQGKLQLSGSELPEFAHISIPELNMDYKIKLNNNKEVAFSFDVKNLKLWSPENPKLYKVILEAGKDRMEDLIGFRTVETKGKEILLNGKPVFLKGICLHDENPLREDRANVEEDAALVLNWAQELGCNFIRLAHYPHQEKLVRMADQRGILLWEELPLYWGIQWDNPQVLEKAKQQYTELINRDYNRASTIIWSIANETAPIPARNQFLSELADYIRSVDDSRLISAACKKDQELDGHPDAVYTYNDPIMDKLDIISLNEYLGWYGGLPEECRKKTFKMGKEKPVIVSEFGGGAMQGFHGDSLTRWSEEFQEYLYKESIEMFDQIDGLVGMTPWILVDFKSPLRQLPEVQDGWNRKGLISEKGQKKKAFYQLQQYYNTK